MQISNICRKASEKTGVLSISVQVQDEQRNFMEFEQKDWSIVQEIALENPQQQTRHQT